MFEPVTKSTRAYYPYDNLISIGFRVPQEELFAGRIKVYPEVTHQEDIKWRGKVIGTRTKYDSYLKAKYTWNKRSTDNILRFLGPLNKKLEHCKLQVSGDAGVHDFSTIFVLVGYVKHYTFYEWADFLGEVGKLQALGEMAKQEVQTLLGYSVTSTLEMHVSDPDDRPDDWY